MKSKKFINIPLIMNQGNIFLSIILFISLLGCARDKEIKFSNNSGNEELEYLYRRPSDNNFILSLPQEEISSNKNDFRATQSLSHLGLSVHPERGLIGENTSLGYPILNVEKLEQDPNGITKKLNKDSIVGKFIVFDSKESLSEKLDTQYSFGFGGNFDLFSSFAIGIEGKIDRVFKKDKTFSSETSFAIANIDYIGDQYFIPHQKDYSNIAIQYLDGDFLSNLYNNPMKELFRMYSEFFISGFYRGGRANLIFRAERKTNSINTSQKLTEYVDASVKVETQDGNASFSHSDSSIKIATNSFKEICVSYNCGGGRNHLMNSIGAVKLNTPNVLDFTPWLQSLISDPSMHTFVDIMQDGGIEPVYKYIKEENFQKRMKLRAFNNKFYVPKIYITIGKYFHPENSIQIIRKPSKEFSKPEPLYVTLCTRHGDLIRLRPYKANDEQYWHVNNKEEFDRKTQELSDLLQKYYKIDIIRVGSYAPLQQKSSQRSDERNHENSISVPVDISYSSFIPPVEIEFYGLDEWHFRKAKHPIYKGINLLLYSNGKDKKMAYVIYDTRLLSAYGLHEIYQSVPSTSVTIEELKGYRLIGL